MERITPAQVSQLQNERLLFSRMLVELALGSNKECVFQKALKHAQPRTASAFKVRPLDKCQPMSYTKETVAWLEEFFANQIAANAKYNDSYVLPYGSSVLRLAHDKAGAAADKASDVDVTVISPSRFTEMVHKFENADNTLQALTDVSLLKFVTGLIGHMGKLEQILTSGSDLNALARSLEKDDFYFYSFFRREILPLDGRAEEILSRLSSVVEGVPTERRQSSWDDIAKFVASGVGVEGSFLIPASKCFTSGPCPNVEMDNPLNWAYTKSRIQLSYEARKIQIEVLEAFHSRLQTAQVIKKAESDLEKARMQTVQHSFDRAVAAQKVEDPIYLQLDENWGPQIANFPHYIVDADALVTQASVPVLKMKVLKTSVQGELKRLIEENPAARRIASESKDAPKMWDDWMVKVFYRDVDITVDNAHAVTTTRYIKRMAYEQVIEMQLEVDRESLREREDTLLENVHKVYIPAVDLLQVARDVFKEKLNQKGFLISNELMMLADEAEMPSLVAANGIPGYKIESPGDEPETGEAVLTPHFHHTAQNMLVLSRVPKRESDKLDRADRLYTTPRQGDSGRGPTPLQKYAQSVQIRHTDTRNKELPIDRVARQACLSQMCGMLGELLEKKTMLALEYTALMILETWPVAFLRYAQCCEKRDYFGGGDTRVSHLTIFNYYFCEGRAGQTEMDANWWQETCLGTGHHRDAPKALVATKDLRDARVAWFRENCGCTGTRMAILCDPLNPSKDLFYDSLNHRSVISVTDPETKISYPSYRLLQDIEKLRKLAVSTLQDCAKEDRDLAKLFQDWKGSWHWDEVPDKKKDLPQRVVKVAVQPVAVASKANSSLGSAVRGAPGLTIDPSQAENKNWAGRSGCASQPLDAAAESRESESQKYRPPQKRGENGFPTGRNYPETKRAKKQQNPSRSDTDDYWRRY